MFEHWRLVEIAPFVIILQWSFEELQCSSWLALNPGPEGGGLIWACRPLCSLWFISSFYQRVTFYCLHESLSSKPAAVNGVCPLCLCMPSCFRGGIWLTCFQTCEGRGSNLGNIHSFCGVFGFMSESGAVPSHTSQGLSPRSLMCFRTNWLLVLCSIPCSTICQLAAAEVTSPPHCWLPPVCLLRTSCWQPKQGFSQQPSHMMNHPRPPPELLALLRLSPDAACCLLPRLKPAALLPISTHVSWWALMIHHEHDFSLWWSQPVCLWKNIENNYRSCTSHQRIQKS